MQSQPVRTPVERFVGLITTDRQRGKMPHSRPARGSNGPADDPDASDAAGPPKPEVIRIVRSDGLVGPAERSTTRLTGRPREPSSAIVARAGTLAGFAP